MASRVASSGSLARSRGLEHVVGPDGAALVLHPEARVAQQHEQVGRVAAKRVAGQHAARVGRGGAQPLEGVVVELAHDVEDDRGAHEQREGEEAVEAVLVALGQALGVEQHDRRAVRAWQQRLPLRARQYLHPAPRGAGVEVVTHVEVARRRHRVGLPPAAQPLCVHVEPCALAVPRRTRHAQHTDGRGHAAESLERGGVELERLVSRVDRDKGHRDALQGGGEVLLCNRLLECEGGALRDAAAAARAVVQLDAGMC